MGLTFNQRVVKRFEAMQEARKALGISDFQKDAFVVRLAVGDDLEDVLEELETRTLECGEAYILQYLASDQ